MTSYIEANAINVFVGYIGNKIEEAITTNIDNFLRNNGTEKYLPNVAGTTIDYSFDSGAALQFWGDNATSAYLNGTFFDDKSSKKSQWEQSAAIFDDFSRMVNL